MTLEKQKTRESGSDNFLIRQSEKLLIKSIFINCVMCIHMLVSNTLWSRNIHIIGKH